MRDGVRHSFTAATKGEAIRQASVFVAEKEYSDREGVTVLEAMNQYIDSKRSILSPTTIRQYERYAESGLDQIKTIPVGRLTSLDVQQAVNAEASRTKARGKEKVSAKYVKNLYSFLSASVKLVRPDLALRVTLPKPVKTYRDLPEPAEVVEAIKGTDIELPALLAAWLSLTASEIRGIKVSSIEGNILTIDETVVQIDGEAVHKKAGKAYGRNRRLKIPKYIMDLIKKTDAWKAGEGYIEPRSGKALSSRFSRVIKNRMRFHDLRHIFASVGLALNVPEKYLMEQGGWSTPSTMKTVYQHTFETERINHQDSIDKYWESLLS